MAAVSGYWLALDGAGIASPNVAPLKQAESSSEYRVVWFGNFQAAGLIFRLCAPAGIGFLVVGGVVRHYENRRIKALYPNLRDGK